jgi:hypothetical protein
MVPPTPAPEPRLEPDAALLRAFCKQLELVLEDRVRKEVVGVYHQLVDSTWPVCMHGHDINDIDVYEEDTDYC